MTLHDHRTVTSESYSELITRLNLAATFETVTGTPLSEFSIDTTDQLPVTLVRETLSEAPGEYILDTPEQGRDPRFRVLELTNTQTRGDSDGA